MMMVAPPGAWATTANQPAFHVSEDASNLSVVTTFSVDENSAFPTQPHASHANSDGTQSAPTATK